ncbi:MAG: outer membrane protein assembly factor BamB [Rhodoferax sp.]|uniref:outer membrane protein assembly factor BamB n=1 Tax=Rhodoferax sp. TaxID=50421 RepID=UPI002ACD8302|nr:outer membrane protein assembly factor BamB [Rhodoferax sp.]MDZ7892094.1 outer membrane protein assembly factor BamB [Rhodoferax sp.]
MVKRYSPLSLTIALISCVVLSACSGPTKQKPAELAPLVPSLGVKNVWKGAVGGVSFPLELKSSGSEIYLATTAGSVVSLDGESGAVRSSGNAGARISAAIGAGDGRVALTTITGEVVVMQGGKSLWRQNLGAVAITPPLVAGGRVFVMTPDRTLSAFDGETGKRLWQQQRGADTLVLDRPGVLFPVGDTLVVGLGGRLVGLNPSNGSQKWDVPVALGRGTNEVERLVDVVSGISRRGASVCVRAYASVVACVDTGSGKSVWSKTANGFTGIGGGDTAVFGSESDGTLIAWSRKGGERLWQSDKFKWRELGTPVLLGSTLVVPDNAGLLHLLSAADGAIVGRLQLDGSPLAATPVLSGNTLVAVTQKGGVFAFRPE